MEVYRILILSHRLGFHFSHLLSDFVSTIGDLDLLVRDPASATCSAHRVS